MAVGGSVGLINGAILTPTKEGESGWNRVGRGVTDMATFATLAVSQPSFIQWRKAPASWDA